MKTMWTRTSMHLPRLTLAAALAACSCAEPSDDRGSDKAVADYLETKWGIVLSEFDVNEDSVLIAEDGTQIIDDFGRITVEGLGSQEVSTQTIISPVSQGSQVSFFVANTDLSDERYFLYDPVENYITIGDLTKGVAVSKNPDGTYDVWAFDGDAMDQFLTVPDGYEALKLVEEYNEFKTISPYLLLTAFASAHGGTPEARHIIPCDYGLSKAAPPPVCEIFKEFCDCAACLVLDRQGACDLCPDL